MDLYWVHPSLAVVTRPTGGRSLPGELAELRGDGVDVLVSCLMPSEEDQLGLIGESAAAEGVGLRFVRARMRDGGTPDDNHAFDRVTARLHEERQAGRRVAVHCRAGIGRSPLVAAALLVRSGESPTEAWSRVGRARGWPVPDNDEQRDWLYGFADTLAGRRERS